ncbi:MAG TPA: TetR family transcriptional regulator [Acidimicrobiia bacterium]|jgi:AcrR family transcriptional regulator
MALAATTRRPRNRKAQISGAAAGLFHRVGYHQVGIDDVAAAVGITGGAIYRHFRSKHDLLAHTVFGGLDVLEAAISAPTHLDRTARALAGLALDDRTLGVLLNREARHLSEPERSEFRRRCRALAVRLGGRVRAARPELSEPDAEFLVACALAVLASPSYHRASVPRGRFEDLMAGLAIAVLSAATVPRPAGPSGPPRHVSPGEETGFFSARTSRREQLVTAAATLFHQRGYPAVTMEDIGTAAGIAGPSIYRHFASKADLLVAGLHRGNEWLQLGMSRALSTATSPHEALQGLVASYVESNLEHTELFGVLLTESIHLPDQERHQLRRIQHDYVSEWVRLLVALRPELTEPEGRVVTQAVLGIVHDCARSRHCRARPGLAGDLVGVGLEALLRSGSP